MANNFTFPLTGETVDLDGLDGHGWLALLKSLLIKHAAEVAAGVQFTADLFTAGVTVSATIGQHAIVAPAGKGFAAGSLFRVVDPADPGQWVTGAVVSYNKVDGAMVVDVQQVAPAAGASVTGNMVLTGSEGPTGATPWTDDGTAVATAFNTLGLSLDAAGFKVTNNGADYFNVFTDGSAKVKAHLQTKAIRLTPVSTSSRDNLTASGYYVPGTMIYNSTTKTYQRCIDDNGTSAWEDF